MTPRAVLLSLVVACVLCAPAIASQPHALAARFITNPAATGPVGEDGLPPVACVPSFAWVETLGPVQMDPADTLTLEMAIIPLRALSTQLILHGGPQNDRLVDLRFADGLVQGVPYDRSSWNDVSVQLRPATQDYTITVNGVTGGPFPFESACERQGGCFSVGAFSLRGFGEEGSVAWIDSVSLIGSTAAGRSLLHEANFDLPCAALYRTTGGLLISEPPPRTRTRR